MILTVGKKDFHHHEHNELFSRNNAMTVSSSCHKTVYVKLMFPYYSCHVYFAIFCLGNLAIEVAFRFYVRYWGLRRIGLFHFLAG